MVKRYSWKIWLGFWLAAAVLLAGWYVFLQIKTGNIENLKPFVSLAPFGAEKRNEINAFMDIYGKIGGFDRPQKGEASGEKNILVLFQNDLELRPGGGFIGSFGVVKMKNGKIESVRVFDTGNFDKNIPETEVPPAPLTEILGTESWKMRDSNWSPDFKTNAEKAEYFYRLGSVSATDKGGNINAVMAINTSVLNSILAVTGPVKIDGYPGEYRDENAILQLEYQVEKGYAEQGIAKAERKNIMEELAGALIQNIQGLRYSQQLALAEKAEGHLKQKDIQLFFKDESLQSEIEKLGWAGKIRNASRSDYLMVIDANLLSLKSDYCIKRKMEYRVDFSGNMPQAILNITYEHTCRAKDWMTSGYRDWLRVYAPKDSALEDAAGQNGDVQVSEELGKQVFGMLVYVPIGENRTISLKYQLPQSVNTSEYHLLIQKQSGSGVVPVNISVKYADGSEKKIQESLTGDREFDFRK
ncbi:MAG TPA: DUF4012 domain-containing protein [Candidatus Bathyarchaeia archaeon]|nr:DUF4012 domain-containing protein [Candidatus Bathyarchaeia archaeon]